MRETGGTITHIASIEGSQPAHGHAHSKAALIMHARSAALEYGRFDIRVTGHNLVVDGGVSAHPTW